MYKALIARLTAFIATLPALSHPTYRLLEQFGSALSCFGNSVLFGGETDLHHHQSISARAYAEGKSDPVWAKRRDSIDAFFFWQPHHCLTAWNGEVAAARRTLEMNEALT